MAFGLGSFKDIARTIKGPLWLIAVGAFIYFVFMAAGTCRAETVDQMMQTEVGQPAEPVTWRWATDNYYPHDDKCAHFGLYFAGATVLNLINDRENKGTTLLSLSMMATLWEVKDALWPWETYGPAGGDGFSTWDLIYSVGGAGLALLIQ